MPPRLKSDYHIADPIQCILTDVDGVMTDGRIVYDAAGLETKRFHVRDGIAIKLWMKSGFRFGIVTARTSDSVKKRASELGIEHVSQGTESKLPAAEQMLEAMGCTASQTP